MPFLSLNTQRNVAEIQKNCRHLLKAKSTQMLSTHAEWRASLFLHVSIYVRVAGESVEENSSVVVKLLIRRPECFGPALRGEGGNGLLAAMKEAIKISETPALDLPGSVQGVSSDV